MKKRLILLLAIMIALVCAVFAIPSNAEVDPEARYVRGGDWIDPTTGKTVNIDSIEKLRECFRDTEKTDKYYARIVENRLVLDYSVVICSPITITFGSYTINGNGCAIYRGFDNGALITLDGTTNSPSLNLGDALQSNETWDENYPNLTLDGNSDEYKNSEFGLIKVDGQASVSISGKVVMQNSISQRGTAIFAQAGQVNSFDNTVRSPSVTIADSVIKNCTTYDGGAVTMYGLNEYGMLLCERIVFKNNKSANASLSGYGGAVRCEGGEIYLKNCTFENNDANRGGALYVCSKGEISGCRFAYNKSTDEGGAICGRASDFGVCDLKFSENVIEYNSTSGVGGGISNYGAMSFEGEGFSFINNNKATGNGGGIYSEGDISISEINITYNESQALGGAIYGNSNSTLLIENGEIRLNTAKYSGAIYCGGEFEFTGGAIGKNKSPAPQIVLKKDSVIAKSASVTDGDVVGLCVTEKDGKGSYSPYIKITEKFSSSTPITVAIYRENVDKNGTVSGYTNITANGNRIFDGKSELLKSAAIKFTVDSSGLISYVLDIDGTVQVRFLFMPIWVCVLIAVIIVLTVITVIAILNRDKLKKLFQKPKKQIVHHKKR